MMPVLFVGHGSPMNAIEKNEYTKGWEEIEKNIFVLFHLLYNKYRILSRLEIKIGADNSITCFDVQKF